MKKYIICFAFGTLNIQAKGVHYQGNFVKSEHEHESFMV